MFLLIESPKSTIPAPSLQTEGKGGEQIKSKTGKRKKMIKIKTGNREIENTEIIKKKFNETIASYFLKMNKTDKPLTKNYKNEE